MTTLSLQTPSIHPPDTENAQPLEQSPASEAPSLRRASLPRRFIGLVEDALVYGLLLLVIQLIIFIPLSLGLDLPSDGLLSLSGGSAIAAVIAEIVFFAVWYPLLMIKRGGTYGYTGFKMQLVADDGKAISHKAAIVRSWVLGLMFVIPQAVTLLLSTVIAANTAGVVGALLWLVLFVFLPAFQPQGRTLHDWASRTRLVYTGTEKIPFL